MFMISQRPQLISWPLLATVTFWGFNFVALKLAYAEVEPAALGVVRWFLMTLLLFPICWYLRAPIRVPGRSAVSLLLMGAFSMGLYMVLFLEGTKRTSPGEAAIVLATAPLFTALWAAVLRQEVVRVKFLGWAVIALAGVTIVVLGSGQQLNGHLVGDMLILGSSIVWAFAAVLSKPLVGQFPPITVLLWSMFGGALILAPYGVSAAIATDWSRVSFLTWSMIGYVTIFAGIAGFLGFYAGVKQVGAPGAMLYQYCVSPLATIFSYLVLKSTLAPIQFLGFAMVLVGVIYANKARVAMSPIANSK